MVAYGDQKRMLYLLELGFLDGSELLCRFCKPNPSLLQEPEVLLTAELSHQSQKPNCKKRLFAEWIHDGMNGWMSAYDFYYSSEVFLSENTH